MSKSGAYGIEVIFKAKEKLKEKKKDENRKQSENDAKLWYVYAVVLARLCVRHGNRNIAHGIQYLCAAYEADGQQGNGRKL